MTSPLCPPCSRLHELVREWADSRQVFDPDRYYNATSALMDAAQQLSDAAAHDRSMPKGNAVPPRGAHRAAQEARDLLCSAASAYAKLARDPSADASMETISALHALEFAAGAYDAAAAFDAATGSAK